MSGSKAREFIAYKRTEKSSWIYDEYSEQTSKAIDEIAPDGGNYCKLILIDKKDFETAVEALKEVRKFCLADMEDWESNNESLATAERALRELGIEV